MKWIRVRPPKAAVILGSLSIMACGPMNPSGTSGDTPKTVQYHAIQAEKLISAGENNPRAPGTSMAPTYLISSSSRLLLRFDGMRAYAEKLNSDGTSKVQVSITPVSDADLQMGKDNVKLCPLTAQFFGSATWNRAHNLGSQGLWQQPGGDFDSAGCITPTLSESTDNPRSLVFDLNLWVRNYLKARGLNYGFIVISSQPVQVYGKLSGAYYPQVRWVQ